MKKLLLSMIIAFTFLGFTALESKAAKFKDVKDNHSLQLEIEYLVDQKVIKGYSDKTFRPNEKISKKHVAAMVVKALKIPTTNVKNPGYKDVPVTHPYYKEIAAAYTAGLFDKSTNFKPNSPISRAFMAQILTRAYNLDVQHTNNAFVDVKKSATFYNAVHAVASNSIANGSRDKNYKLRFEPNKLLTRGHFAAFLARAMTLNTNEYAANENYNYYFTTSDGIDMVSVYEYNEVFEENLWQDYDLATNEQLSLSGYNVYNNEKWMYGTPNSGNGLFVNYPFTIGMKLAFTYDFDLPDMQLKVLDTNTSITVDGEILNYVTIVEEQYYDFDMYDKIQFSYYRFYLAPDYGLVKSEAGEVGQKPTWHYALTHREFAQ